VGGVGDYDGGRSDVFITIFGRLYLSLYRNGGAGDVPGAPNSLIWSNAKASS
jgi:hypothetical protein